MNFRVIDLNSISPADLQYHPKPIADWPITVVNVEENKNITCIASWRWDVQSDKEKSNNLSECAWDALMLGFRYMLCDIISINQKESDISSRLVIYSSFYNSLHCVISYKADDDLHRSWLKYEGAKILKSPTYLGYLFHKWKLKVPLTFSLIIKQVAGRRLGIPEINEDKLYLCDTDEANYLTIKDLDLDKSGALDHAAKIITLDRRDQTFASDRLLIFEIGCASPRNDLIEILQKIKSNSEIVPALLIIWSMAEGLSISIRGCDWNLESVISWTYKLLIKATTNTEVKMDCILDKEIFKFICDDGKEQVFPIEIQKPEGRLQILKKENDLLCRFWQKEIQFSHPNLKSQFLKYCLEIALLLVGNKDVVEPAPLTDNDPQYRLVLDDYHHFK